MAADKYTEAQARIADLEAQLAEAKQRAEERLERARREAEEQRQQLQSQIDAANQRAEAAQDDCDVWVAAHEEQARISLLLRADLTAANQRAEEQAGQLQSYGMVVEAVRATLEKLIDRRGLHIAELLGATETWAEEQAALAKKALEAIRDLTGEHCGTFRDPYLEHCCPRCESAVVLLQSDAAQRALSERRELERDRERLDWMEKQVQEYLYHADFAIQSDEEDGVWFTRITRHSAGELRQGLAYDDERSETVRQAIDAAMGDRAGEGQ